MWCRAPINLAFGSVQYNSKPLHLASGSGAKLQWPRRHWSPSFSGLDPKIARPQLMLPLEKLAFYSVISRNSIKKECFYNFDFHYQSSDYKIRSKVLCKLKKRKVKSLRTILILIFYCTLWSIITFSIL
jgi:hypothetical protein